MEKANPVIFVTTSEATVSHALQCTEPICFGGTPALLVGQEKETHVIIQDGLPLLIDLASVSSGTRTHIIELCIAEGVKFVRLSNEPKQPEALPASDAKTATLIKTRNIELDTLTRTCLVDSQVIRLKNKEWELLELLLRNPGVEFSTSKLAKLLCPRDADGIDENYIVTCIHYLRQKLRLRSVETGWCGLKKQGKGQYFWDGEESPVEYSDSNSENNSSSQRNSTLLTAVGYGIALDTLTRSCTVNGQKVSLTHTEFACLEFLMRNPGIPQTRAKLIEVSGIANHEVRNMDPHIMRLRRKIGNTADDSQAQLIQTVPKCGYRFSLDYPVTFGDSPALCRS